MNLIETTREKKREFFNSIKNNFDIEIQKEKINLESFLSNKMKYISLINNSLGLVINDNFNIEDLKKNRNNFK